MNISWSRRFFEELHAEGIRDIVFCPGARNSPLISMLAHTKGFRLHSFFEERDAAFFALGLARRTGEPVAVITTSGTAAAECLPAAVEAYHSGVPLLLVTADRPRRLRGTGAPQSIDQVGLFAKFLQFEIDIEDGEPFSLEKWHRRAPVHINICFDEPLIDEPFEPLELAPAPAKPSFAGRSQFMVSAGPEWAVLRLTKFLKTQESPIVIVGTLETVEEREAVVDFLLKLRAPVYLESTSGLREDPRLNDIALRSGEKILNWSLRRNLFTGVVRIGGVPTARIWRDLDERGSAIDVFSLSPLPFAGLSRGEMVCAEIAPSLRLYHAKREPSPRWQTILMKDRAVESTLLKLIESEPLAEPSLFNQLSRIVADAPLVYVGNSLPIREWDLAASREKIIRVEANRGVNGIDGQIATFFGLATGANTHSGDNWAIIGDLTALYSLAAPWILSNGRMDFSARIVIVNNGGGKIFSRIFKTDLFVNRHAIDFEPWAKFWKLGYQKWTSIPDSVPPLEKGQVEVIELIPDEQATTRFWERYDGFWE